MKPPLFAPPLSDSHKVKHLPRRTDQAQTGKDFLQQSTQRSSSLQSPPALGVGEGLGTDTEPWLKLEGAQLELWAFLSTMLLSPLQCPPQEHKDREMLSGSRGQLPQL